MRCFQLTEVDKVEPRIPISTQDGTCFIKLSEKRTVDVCPHALEDSEEEGFIERVSVEFLDEKPKYRLVRETKADSDQALLMLPPTNRFSYVSLSEDRCDLTSASDTVSLLLILQPGNQILVTPQADDEQLTQWVLHFDGETITSKPLKNS